jgi:hypothetical protein
MVGNHHMVGEYVHITILFLSDLYKKGKFSYKSFASCAWEFWIWIAENWVSVLGMQFQFLAF